MDLLYSHVLHQHLFPSPQPLILRWAGICYVRTLGQCIIWVTVVYLHQISRWTHLLISLKGRKNGADWDQTQAYGFITKPANNCITEVNKDWLK